MPGSTPRTQARPLDPDRPIWERQDGETNQAYEAFVKFRDMDKRSTTRIGSAANRWSPMWSWQARVREWDRHLSRLEADELVRYRVSMNERQRAIARVAQNKVVQWLESVDPSKLKPSDAVRWFEVAVRVEREAAGAGMAHADVSDSAMEDAVNDALAGLSFKDLLNDAKEQAGDLDDLDEAEAAERLYRSMRNGSR